MGKGFGLWMAVHLADKESCGIDLIEIKLAAEGKSSRGLGHMHVAKAGAAKAASCRSV